MKLLSQLFHYISGQIYIPEKLKNASKIIVHISDTPSQVYPSIIKLTSILKPDILVHTGDIVDDVKLEMVPDQLPCYLDKANSFLAALSQHVKESIILVPGNHDRVEMLDLCSNIKVFQEGAETKVHGITLGLSHKFENLPQSCDYYLYGHDKTSFDSKNYMNGIEFISIIDINSLDMTKLHYPSGTDNYRLRRIKIGI